MKLKLKRKSYLLTHVELLNIFRIEAKQTKIHYPKYYLSSGMITEDDANYRYPAQTMNPNTLHLQEDGCTTQLKIWLYILPQEEPNIEVKVKEQEHALLTRRIGSRLTVLPDPTMTANIGVTELPDSYKQYTNQTAYTPDGFIEILQNLLVQGNPWDQILYMMNAARVYTTLTHLKLASNLLDDKVEPSWTDWSRMSPGLRQVKSTLTTTTTETTTLIVGASKVATSITS